MPPEISLRELFKTIDNNNDSIAVLFCDFRQYYKMAQLPSNTFTDKWQNNNIYFYSDISLPENREAQNIFCFDHLPAIVHFDKDGSVSSIDYCMYEHAMSEREKNYCSTILRGYLSLCSESPDNSLFNRIINDTTSVDNIYVNTLIARYYDSLDQPQIDDRYWQRAVSIFENNPDEIVEHLYISSLQRLNDTLFHIIAKPTCIVLEDFPIQSDTITNIILSNYGNRVFVLSDIRTSCSCVKVQSPRLILPGNSDTLKIHYFANNEPGSFEQVVRINPLFNKKNINITINGTKK